MKFLIVCALIAVTAAAPQHFYGGHLAAAPISYGHAFAPAIVKAPVYAAPVVKHVAPAASSYQTFSQVVSHPQPVVKYAAAPVVSYAPAPVVKYASAPVVSYASAPVVKYAAPLVNYAPAPVVKYAAAPAYAAPVYSQGYGNVYGHGF